MRLRADQPKWRYAAAHRLCHGPAEADPDSARGRLQARHEECSGKKAKRGPGWPSNGHVRRSVTKKLEKAAFFLFILHRSRAVEMKQKEGRNIHALDKRKCKKSQDTGNFEPLLGYSLPLSALLLVLVFSSHFQSLK